MEKEIAEFLEKEGWTIECESPFELRNVDGSFASGQAAKLVIEHIKNSYFRPYEL